jgi:hypothetical protein
MDAHASHHSLSTPQIPTRALKRRKWGIFDVAYEEPSRLSIFRPLCTSEEFRGGVATLWRMFTFLFTLTTFASLRYCVSHLWQATSPAISLLLAYLSLNLVRNLLNSLLIRSNGILDG